MMVYSHEKNCFTSITAEVYLSSLPLDLKARHCSGTLLVILKKIPPIVNSLRERQQRFPAPAMPCQAKANENYGLFGGPYIAQSLYSLG